MTKVKEEITYDLKLNRRDFDLSGYSPNLTSIISNWQPEVHVEYVLIRMGPTE